MKAISKLPQNSLITTFVATRISLPIGTNRKQLAAIDKFSSAVGKLLINKTLATNEEKITNTMIGNDVQEIYW